MIFILFTKNKFLEVFKLVVSTYYELRSNVYKLVKMNNIDFFILIDISFKKKLDYNS